MVEHSDKKIPLNGSFKLLNYIKIEKKTLNKLYITKFLYRQKGFNSDKITQL